MALAFAYLLSVMTTLAVVVVGHPLLLVMSLSLVGAYGYAEQWASALASALTVLLAASLATAVFLLFGAQFGLWAVLLATAPHTAITTARYWRLRLNVDRASSLGALVAFSVLLLSAV